MDAEVVVIGTGVIGLAIAAEIASKGRSVILLEKEARYGLGVSSRNTEVIHAGIYYQTGSLKASLCVRGKKLLYEYCDRFKIKNKKSGKIILAVTKEESERLVVVKKQAFDNGVDDIVELDKKGIGKLEPALYGVAALFSPSSGILDTHGFMKSLWELGRADGVIFAALSPVIGAEAIDNGWSVRIGGNEPSSITCRLVVNAAGLHAIDLSRKIHTDRKLPKLHPLKGSYARYSGVSPLRHIIYPAMVPGVIEERLDSTPDLGDSLRFGPTTEKPESLEDFSIAPGLIEKVFRAVKRYLPGLDISKIYPDCAGIRPRIYGPGDPVQDFCFEWAQTPGWLDLLGIESPGLTSSLAIAEHVYGLIKEKGIL